MICEVSGYGAGGPYEQRKAYDLLVQAEAGLISVTGTPEVPCKVGISVADISAGMYAYSGILTALMQRVRTGEGTVVQVALFDTLGEWMSQPAYYAGAAAGASGNGVADGEDGEGDSGRLGDTARSGDAAEALPRSGAKHATIAPYGPFSCSNGQVFLGIQNDREWERFCRRVLGQAELATHEDFRDNPARVANRQQLQELVETVFSDQSVDDVLESLEGAGIASARMSTVRQFIDHPQLAARARWRQIDSPVGPLRALLPPVIMEGVDPHMGPVPAIGEHTDAILRELDFDEGAIDDLRRTEVI